MGVSEIEEFLTHLTVEGNVAAATQNQALNAILFLYRQVLQQELDSRINAIRAKRPQQIPIVLSPDEAFAIIQQTTGVHRCRVGKFVMICTNKYQLTFAHQFLVLSGEHFSCSKVPVVGRLD
jgi:site-specific recombinase XerD